MRHPRHRLCQCTKYVSAISWTDEMLPSTHLHAHTHQRWNLNNTFSHEVFMKIQTLITIMIDANSVCSSVFFRHSHRNLWLSVAAPCPKDSTKHNISQKDTFRITTETVDFCHIFWTTGIRKFSNCWNVTLECVITKMYFIVVHMSQFSLVLSRHVTWSVTLQLVVSDHWCW